MGYYYLIDQMVGFRKKWHVDGNDVGLGKELIHGNILGIRDRLDPIVGGIGVVTENFLAESGDFLHGLLSNQAGSDDADVLKIFYIYFICDIFVALKFHSNLVLNQDTLQASDGEVCFLG